MKIFDVHSVHLSGVATALKEWPSLFMGAVDALKDGSIRLPQVHWLHTS
jgi:hypothetical protein